MFGANIRSARKTSKSMGSWQARQRVRHGTATVELALTLPVLLVFILGTIEVCQMMFVRQTATLVAYEGARLATRRSMKSSDVHARCQALLAARRAVGGLVTLTPPTVESLTAGQEFRVSVNIPWAANTPVRFVTGSVSRIEVSATMVRE